MIVLGFGHARHPSGKVVVREGTMRREIKAYTTALIDPLCPCERDLVRGYVVMCSFCTGPQYATVLDHTDGDL